MGLYPMFLENTGKICHKWLHYFPIYEHHLSRFCNLSVTLFEIGVFKGGSLNLWKEYLGAMATIVGLDINPECRKHEQTACHVRIGKQADANFLKSVLDEFGNPDIIIDDGSHMQKDMTDTFEFIYPFLNNNGVYIVEDVHTCYWEKYSGGLRKTDTFIEKAKDMVDNLNAWHFMNPDAIPGFCNSTWSVSFYDSVVVFEKRKHGKPTALMTGKSEVAS